MSECIGKVKIVIVMCNPTVYKARNCVIVYEDMHYKDLLGSITREGYHIPVQDFYLHILLRGL